MASEIIYGCVEADMTITFDQDPDCQYSGCYYETGIHAQQIGITIDNDYCDDEYYGCVDWGNNGKFEVSVPDYCCTGLGEDHFCDDCFESVEAQPVKLRFTWHCDNMKCPGQNGCPAGTGLPCCAGDDVVWALYPDPVDPCEYNGLSSKLLECGVCDDEGTINGGVRFVGASPGGKTQWKLGLSGWNDINTPCSTTDSYTHVGCEPEIALHTISWAPW